LPPYQIRKRIKDYIEYLETCDEDDAPIALFAFSTTAELLRAKRRFKLLLEGCDEDDIPAIRLTTTEKVEQYGLVGKIWEEV
jgi:chromatin segregation and condensation protein Rec8/ScpA/Scc1 (kleisin family)